MQNKASAADFKAEKFSKLSHLFLNGQVIVEHTVLTWHVGKPVLWRATSLSFKNLLSTFYSECFCKLNSEGELNSYCPADFRAFSPRQNTNLCAYWQFLQLSVKEMPFKIEIFLSL